MRASSDNLKVNVSAINAIIAFEEISQLKGQESNPITELFLLGMRQGGRFRHAQRARGHINGRHGSSRPRAAGHISGLSVAVDETCGTKIPLLASEQGIRSRRYRPNRLDPGISGQAF